MLTRTLAKPRRPGLLRRRNLVCRSCGRRRPVKARTRFPRLCRGCAGFAFALSA